MCVPHQTDSDLLVANSARVSLSKSHSSLSANDETLIRFLYRHNHWTPFGHPQLSLYWQLTKAELKNLLLNQTLGSEIVIRPSGMGIERGSLWYWIKNRHLYGNYQSIIENEIAYAAPVTARILGIPEHNAATVSIAFTITDEWVAEDVKNRLKLAWITVLVEAPVPIRTQLFKHKVGFTENEVSRRYVDAPPTFYLPPEWRARAPNVKQGSLKTPIKYPLLANWVAKIVYFVSNCGYRSILALGGCPEQARFLLPQGMMTQWYWTGSLDAIFRAIHLRDDQHAQEESWKIMQSIKSEVEKSWPLTSQRILQNSSANTDPM